MTTKLFQKGYITEKEINKLKSTFEESLINVMDELIEDFDVGNINRAHRQLIKEETKEFFQRLRE